MNSLSQCHSCWLVWSMIHRYHWFSQSSSIHMWLAHQYFTLKKIEGRQSACQQNVTIIELGWCYCPLTKFWLFYKQGWDKRHQSQGRLLTLPRTRAPHREGHIHSHSYQFKYIDLFIYLQGVAIYLCIDSLQWWQMCLQFTEQKENIYYYDSKKDSTLRLIGKGLSLIIDTPMHPVCMCVRVYTFPICALRGCMAIWSTHTCVSLAIAPLVNTAVTVSCPQRSLDIQCKSSPVELWKKLIICYCSLGPPVASPSEHHCHLTHGPLCDNGQ